MFKQTEFSDQAVKRHRNLFNVFDPTPYPAIKSEYVEKDNVQNVVLDKVKSLADENYDLREKIAEMRARITMLENAPSETETAQELIEFVDVEEHILNPDGTTGKLYTR